ncbi:MAG: hypothetical protein Q9195_005355 [Heterodermia aff. obscurata]
MSAPTDVKAGSILFLPRKVQVRLYSDVLASDSEAIEEGQYNHPVLIFAVSRDKTRVLALILTTFGNTPISTKFPDRDSSRSNAHILRIRRLYLPIHPAEHPDPLITLRLADNLTLNRNSYVRIETPVIIETRLLRHLYVGPRRLKKGSFKELQTQVQFQIPDGFSTTTRVVSPISNDLPSIPYPNRLYDVVNERPAVHTPVDPSSYAAVLLQHGITPVETRPQHHNRPYRTPNYQPTTPTPVVQAAYIPPVLHNTAPVAAYRAPVYEVEDEERERDALLGRRDPPSGTEAFLGLIGLLIFLGVLGLGGYGIFRVVKWAVKWIKWW